MKTEHPAPIADVDRSPTSLPLTKLPEGVHPGYFVGERDQTHSGRIVAYAIHVRADFKVGDREFSGEICLHEAAMWRRHYEENSGSIRLEASWPPGLRRMVPLNQEQLTVEVNRLRESLVITSPNGKLDILSLYLGVEPGEQLKRMHALMGKQVAAWATILEKAKERIPANEVHPDPEVMASRACDHITARELEELANIADPSRDGLDDLILPEATPVGTIPYTPAAPAKSIETIMSEAEAEIDGKPDDLIDQTIARLKDAGLDETQALTVASLQEMAPGVEIADADLSSAIGSGAKSKIAAVRKALRG